ncbi:MAG: hypothetical protein QME76_12535 [Bacillota bacterium]|nr:hypothetical protein [Bacillota bacterium]
MPKTVQKAEVSARVAEGEKLVKVKIAGVEHLVRPEDVELEKLIAEGCRLTQQLAALQEKLKAVKERAVQIAASQLVDKKSAKLVGIAGVAEVTLKQDLKVVNAAALRELFGANFGFYVAEEVTFKAQKPLRAAVADADHPQRDILREAVAVKESEYVRFIPRGA